MGNQVSDKSVTSVVRVFGILDVLSNEREIGLSELSAKMFMSKSTVFRFLQTMKELGYVSQDPETEKYSLTMKLFQLGSNALNLHDLNRVANKHMTKLADKTHETVHLAVLDEESKSVIYIHKVEAEQLISMMSRIGRKAPIHCTALGKVLSSSLDDSEVNELVNGLEYRKYTINTIDNENAFMNELNLVREQGFAEDVGEHEDNVRCIGAPVLDRFGNTTAGLSVTWPAFRFDEEKREVYIKWVTDTANAISKEIGYSE